MQNPKLLENPDYIITIIERLKKQFEEKTFPKYNHYNRDAVSFYLTGHCPSFARILNDVFYDLGTFYDDFDYKGEKIGHIITKIGDHYYDVSGIVDYYVENNPKQFQECAKDYYSYLEETLCKKDEHAVEIQEELIAYGKGIIQSVLIHHNNCLIRKLEIPSTNKK